VIVDLTDKERAILAKLVRTAIAKEQRHRANKERAGKVYTPPPGKRHATDSKVEILGRLADKLEGRIAP
jgi:hypothetical protein